MQKQLCGNRFSPFMEKMFDWDFGQSVPIQESPRGAGVRRGTGLVPPPPCRSLGFLQGLWSHQTLLLRWLSDGSASRPNSQKSEVFNYLPLQMLDIPPSQCPICLYNNLILGRQRPGFIAL